MFLSNFKVLTILIKRDFKFDRLVCLDFTILLQAFKIKMREFAGRIGFLKSPIEKAC